MSLLQVPDGGKRGHGRRSKKRLLRGQGSLEEPLYSSPNPAHVQYPHPGTHSTTLSTSQSTPLHTESQHHHLMANMLQSAADFTSSSTRGSSVLPPPLLPPPQGFDKDSEVGFIPGTSLPKFLPPPRVPIMSPDRAANSRLNAYDFDPEAPPIPPRNYTREEAGLPPLTHPSASPPPRPETRDAQVEAREDEGPRASPPNVQVRRAHLSLINFEVQVGCWVFSSLLLLSYPPPQSLLLDTYH